MLRTPRLESAVEWRVASARSGWLGSCKCRGRHATRSPLAGPAFTVRGIFLQQAEPGRSDWSRRPEPSEIVGAFILTPLVPAGVDVRTMPGGAAEGRGYRWSFESWLRQLTQPYARPFSPR